MTLVPANYTKVMSVGASLGVFENGIFQQAQILFGDTRMKGVSIEQSSFVHSAP